jgi:hypothetical protein
VLCTAIVLHAAGQDSSGPSPPAEATIVGRIDLPEDEAGGGQAVLMPPEWASAWDREAQERIDLYSSRYREILLRDPERFDEIARLARRDAVSDVMFRMQARLGEAFRDLVRSIPADGYFEFSGLPLGEYRILVLVQGEGDPLMWMETVSLTDSIPVFVQLQDRIQ